MICWNTIVATNVELREYETIIDIKKIEEDRTRLAFLMTNSGAESDLWVSKQTRINQVNFDELNSQGILLMASSLIIISKLIGRFEKNNK